MRPSLGHSVKEIDAETEAVTQHLADDRQGHAAHQRVAGERVPQVQETVIRPTNLPEEAIFHCLLKSSSYIPKP